MKKIIEIINYDKGRLTEIKKYDTINKKMDFE
jgi:hypothetical protein